MMGERGRPIPDRGFPRAASERILELLREIREDLAIRIDVAFSGKNLQ